MCSLLRMKISDGAAKKSRPTVSQLFGMLTEGTQKRFAALMSTKSSPAREMFQRSDTAHDRESRMLQPKYPFGRGWLLTIAEF